MIITEKEKKERGGDLNELVKEAETVIQEKRQEQRCGVKLGNTLDLLAGRSLNNLGKMRTT